MSSDNPTTPAEVFAAMPGEINTEKAKDINATFQFELEGNQGGTWAVKIADSECTVENSAIENPTVRIKMTDEDFVALATGKIQAIPAFLSGKIRVYGDYVLATKLPVLFES